MKRIYIEPQFTILSIEIEAQMQSLSLPSGGGKGDGGNNFWQAPSRRQIIDDEDEEEELKNSFNFATVHR